MKTLVTSFLDEFKKTMVTESTENYDRAVSELAKPLDSAQITALNAFCELHNMKPFQQAIMADYANMKAITAAEIDCKSCVKHSRANCFKYVPIRTDDRLLVDKRICNSNRILTIIHNSGIPESYGDFSVNSFPIDGANCTAVNFAKDTISDGTGLYIHGRAGVGKTLLACAIVVSFAKIGKTSLFRSINDILNDLNLLGDSDKLKRAELANKYKNIPCLVIDDLGAENVTSWSKSVVFELIDARYVRGLTTIVTSNLDEVHLKNIYGDRITRRLQEMCRFALIIG